MYKIYVSALAFDGGKSGISNYIENCVYNLALENKIYVAILEKDIKKFTRKHKNIEFIPFADFFNHPLANFILHLFLLPFFIRSDCDFIFLPAANRRLMFFYPKFTVATFHDLSQFYIKGKYDFLRMFYIKWVIPIFLKKVHKIVCVSQNTKDDLLKFFTLEKNNISVLENGFDKSLFSFDKSTKSLLEKEYFLYVARIEYPGKNHLNLIKAYELLPLKIKEKYDLVFVGQDRQNAHIVREYINNSKDENRIKVLGFVSNEQLPNIYKNAKMFIFPSFYEGFGIPLIEAMASAIPILSANNSSLKDIGAGVSKFFDEKDIYSIKSAIIELLKDENLQKQMIENGLKKVNKYDWSYHANSIIKLYEQK